MHLANIQMRSNPSYHCIYVKFKDRLTESRSQLSSSLSKEKNPERKNDMEPNRNFPAIGPLSHLGGSHTDEVNFLDSGNILHMVYTLFCIKSL